MTGDGVTVRWGRLKDYAAEPFESLLTTDERDRAAAFIFERDRNRYVIARGLLRIVLGECLAEDPRRVRFAYGEHGKPRLAYDAELRFNLSHSHGVVAIALCEGREVGVDVEAQREGLDAEGIARRYLPAAVADEIELEAAPARSAEFFRAWVRQEAYAKGRGEGLALIGQQPIGWCIADLELPDGYAGAVAVEGAGPVRPRVNRLMRRPT
jgi:4'-phosphopantetheinyl transferase